MTKKSIAEPIADVEAERATIGSILQKSEAMPLAMMHVRAEDFTDEKCRAVFTVMAESARASRIIDLPTVASDLRARGQLERVGGLPGLIEFKDAAATHANLEHYAKRVSERAVTRRMMAAMHEMVLAAPSARDDEEFRRNSLERILALGERHAHNGTARGAEWSPRQLKILEERAEKKMPPGIESGLEGLDAACALRRGCVSTVAGRPRNAKTSLAINVALFNSVECDLHAWFGSLEMSEEQISKRMIACMTSVDTTELDRPENIVGTDAWQRVYDAHRELSERAPDLWCPQTSVTIEEIRMHVLQAHALRPLDLVILDYVQLVHGTRGERRSTRAEELEMIMLGLRALAKQVNAPILLLSQMNRSIEERGGGPQLSDLKSAGAIEECSDFVAFLERPILTDKNADPDEAIITIRKNRHGCEGEYRLRFEARFQRFSDAGQPAFSFAQPGSQQTARRRQNKGASHPRANGHAVPGEAHE